MSATIGDIPKSVVYDFNSFGEVTPQRRVPNFSNLEKRLDEYYKKLSEAESLSLKDFRPINTWEVDEKSELWEDTNIPMDIEDKTTGKKYWNESKKVIGFKCLLLTIGTPIFHSISSLLNVIFRILKVASFSHFFIRKEGEGVYSLKGRVKDLGKDLLKIVTTPILLVALELAAIYGIFNPLDGRKLYASLEKLQVSSNYHFSIMPTSEKVLAPCFQPGAISHFFGSDPGERNGF